MEMMSLEILLILRNTDRRLIYLMVSTRPDISYTVSVLSRFMQEPRELHGVCQKIIKIYKNNKRLLFNLH